MNLVKILYIDPGTGGMLFSVLFGLFGVALFSLRALLMRVKYRSSVDKNSRLYDQKIPIVIFNEHKRYWNIFEPIMDELDKKDRKIVYLACSEDDPAFKKNTKT